MKGTDIYADRSLVFIDGKILVTDKNWIRDHVHVMKAMRHWEYDVYSPAKKIDAHILLPSGKPCKTLLVNGTESPFTAEKIAESDYVNITVTTNGKISFEILF